MIELSQINQGQHIRQRVSAPKFAKEYDVMVCGLGTAGSLAALFCAENGLSVLGVESFTCLGGTHTAGGVSGHYFGCPGGRYEALEEKVQAYAQQYTCTVPESRKFVVEQALQAEGVEILYEASVCGVFLEEKTVVGLRVLQDGQLVDYKAKLVMDCTAEAYVAVMAGCETEFGRETDGQAQPYSLVSMVYNGERYRYNNVDFGRVDPCDPEALSQAILFARGYKMEEAYRGKRHVAQMPLLGIREGRRIIAQQRVCLEDLFADKQTETPMFYAYADLDKHGWDIAFDSALMGDWAIGANLGAYNVTVAVPYQAIAPKDYDGILVPCRALGVDRDISSCVRMILDMKKTAEAAAQWATLAIGQKTTLGQVSYDRLKEKLVASGCLKDTDNRGYRIDGRKNWDGTELVKEDVHWITDPERLPARLKTEKPGQAIWSSRRLGEKALPVLQECVAAEDENLRKHAAFALAMLGSHRANTILRDMVIQRDGFMLTDCRKHNNLRGCMAIYWLGRLADREIVPQLTALICDEKEVDKAVYDQTAQTTTRYKIADFNNTYFQFISQSVMALVRIGDVHTDLRQTIAKAFVDAFSDGSYYHRITQRPPMSSEGNMVLTMKNIAFSAMEKWNAK